MQNAIILGSGRSGTSMLAGSLSGCGYYMGDSYNYLGKDQANPKGYFEDKEINLINEDILKLHLINYPEKIRRRIFPTRTFYRSRWLARIPNYRTITRSNKNINSRIFNLIHHAPFCFKDPRFSYTLPVWKKLLPEETKMLVIFRNPVQTADSIVRLCNESPALRHLKINTPIALQAWHSMYSHILKNYKADKRKNNWLFIHFDQMFDSTCVKHINEFLNINLSTTFQDPTLSRSKHSDLKLSYQVESTHSKLVLLSNQYKLES
jgi:hypothetical protein